MANLLDWLDRDKEKQGFQLTSAQTRANLGAIKQGMVSEQQKTVGNKTGNAKLNLFANLSDMSVNTLGKGKLGYGVAGAAEIPGSILGFGGQKQQTYNQNMTPSQDNARRVGKFLYGTALTAPLRGPGIVNKAVGAGRDAIVGGAFGAVSTTASALGQKRLPTIQELKQGISSGAENSWVYPATNAVTNKMLGAAGKKVPFLNKYTDEMLRKTSTSIKDQGFKKMMSKIPGAMINSGTREAMETPIETAYFASQEPGSFTENYKKRFISDLVSNFVIGTGRSGIDIGVGSFKSKIKADGDAYLKESLGDPKKRFTLKFDGDNGKVNLTNMKGEDFREFTRNLDSRGVKWDHEVYVPAKSRIKPDNGKNAGFIDFEVLLGMKNDTEADQLKNSRMPEKKKYLEPMNETIKNRGITVGTGYKVGGKDIGFEKLMSEGWKPDQIDYAVKLANYAKTSPENAEGYVRGILGKQYPNTKPIKVAKEDPGYMDSLVNSEPKITDVYNLNTKAGAEAALKESDARLKLRKTPIEEPPITTDPPRIKIQQPGSNFKARVMNIKTVDEGKAVVAQVSSVIDQIGPDKMKQMSEDIESGKPNKFITSILDTFKEKTKQSGVDVGTLPNYIHRTTVEHAQKIIAEGVKPDTAGSILTDTPSFSKKRTGKLTDYDKTGLYLKSYMIESLRNVGLSDAQKQDLKVATEIKKELATTKSYWRNLPWSKRTDFVAKHQGDTQGEKSVKLPDERSATTGLKEAFYSTEQLSRKAGGDFYDRFFKPWRDFQQDAHKKTTEINKSTFDELKLISESLDGRKIGDSVKEADLRSYLIRRYYASEKAKVTDKFLQEIKTSKFEDKAGKDLVNSIYDEFIGDDIRLKGTAEKIGDGIRKNTGRATMGLNVTPAINNVFEIKRAYSLVGGDNFAKGFKDTVAGTDFTQKYGIDSERSSVVERSKVESAINKYDNVLYKLFSESEKFKDNILLGAFENQGKQKGLDGQKLNDYVIRKFDKYAIKYGVGQDIGLYRSPLFKTLFQFGQYPIKDLEIFGEKLKGTLKGDKGDAKYIAKYTFASVVQMGLMKLAIGSIGFGGQSNTPRDFLVNIAQWEFPFSPIVNSAYQLASLIHAEMTDKDDYEKEQIGKSLTRSAAMLAPLPSNQVYFKTIKAAQNIAKGYQETSGGNVANPTSNNPVDNFKSLVFGPGYDPNRQGYIARYKEGQKRGDEYSNAGLNKAESFAFKNTPKDQQQKFYDETVAGNQRMSQVKRDVAESGKEKKPNIFARIAGIGKEEEKPTFDTSTPAMKALQLSKIDDKIKYGEELTPEETDLKYFDEYNSMPTGSRYELREKEKEGYKVARTLVDNDFIPQEQKEAIYKKLETSEEELRYYDVADANDDDQRMYITDEIASMSEDERADFLVRARSVVNGKILVTDTIANKLYDEGVISKGERDALKSFKYIKDNSYTGEDAIKMGDNTYRPEKIVDRDAGGKAKGFGTDNMIKAKLPTSIGKAQSVGSSGSFILAPKSSGSSKMVKIAKPDLQKGKNQRKIKLKY